MSEEQPPAPIDDPEDLPSAAPSSEASLNEESPSEALPATLDFGLDEDEVKAPALQVFWQSTQPRLKAGTITVLKTFIMALEKVVAQLEEAPPATTADSAQPRTQPTTSPIWLNQLWHTVQTSWQNFWSWWRGVLPKIRGVLPGAFNEALSDRALTGAIAGVLLLVLWIGSSLFSSPPPKQVAVVPPPPSTPAKSASPKETSPNPKLPEVKVIPPPNASPTPAPPTTTPKPAPTPIGQSTPETSPTPSPRPAPAPPPLKLTPEQTLIARIQDQVAAVSDQYVNGLIQAVQANFRASRLTVKVGDGWYGLLPIQQDNLANDMLKRAQQLNFVKLEVTDTKGMLLARSPVVGSEMVVLQRSTT